MGSFHYVGLIVWPLIILSLAHIGGAALPFGGGGSSFSRIVRRCRGFPFVVSVMGSVPCFLFLFMALVFSVLAGLD